MLKIISLLLFLFILPGCGVNKEKSPVTFYPVKKESFAKYVNQKKISGTPNLSEDIHIINNDYPIEISLYKNGRWYYNLENLDDGEGTWKYNEGRLELFANRALFDIRIDIEGSSEGAPDVVIRFSDRFGPKTLKMEKVNILTL